MTASGLSPEMRAAAQRMTDEARCENCGAMSLTRRSFGCHRCGHWPAGCCDGGIEALAKQLGFCELLRRPPVRAGCRSVHCWAAIVIALLAFGMALAAISGFVVLIGR